MQFKSHRYFTLVICGLFFILDRFLKWQALHGWAGDRLLHRWFGWHPFLNPGVAFGIPVPGWLVIFLTVPVIILIIYHISFIYSQNNDRRYMIYDIALASILLGAISNLLDRIFYGHTVDYLLIFTGVINLADVMIVAGGVVYFMYNRKFVPPKADQSRAEKA